MAASHPSDTTAAPSDEAPVPTAPPPYRKPKLRYKERFLGYPLEVPSYRDLVLPGADRKRTKFVIFSRGRSGTTLLERMIDAHSEITCLDEILKYRMLFPYNYARYRTLRTPSPVAGYKLLAYQLRDIQRIDDGNVFLRRSSDEGYKIIYVRRNNLLSLSISNIYAWRRGVYHHYEAGAGEKTVIRIEPQELMQWMTSSQAQWAYERYALRDLSYLSLVYEDDLADHTAQTKTLGRVFDLLGVEPQTIPNRLEKVTPRKIGDFVENADELLRFVEGTEFAKYLDGVR